MYKSDSFINTVNPNDEILEIKFAKTHFTFIK